MYKQICLYNMYNIRLSVRYVRVFMVSDHFFANDISQLQMLSIWLLVMRRLVTHHPPPSGEIIEQILPCLSCAPIRARTKKPAPNSRTKFGSTAETEPKRQIYTRLYIMASTRLTMPHGAFSSIAALSSSNRGLVLWYPQYADHTRAEHAQFLFYYSLLILIITTLLCLKLIATIRHLFFLKFRICMS